MKKFLVTLVYSTLCINSLCTYKPINDKNYINYLNTQPNTTWVAGENRRWDGMMWEDINDMFGVRRLLGAMKPNKEHVVRTVDSIPSSFDARNKWGGYIHPIRNQEECGSCWAFSASEVLSDRFTIASNGDINVVLSPEDLVSCDTANFGCKGGELPLTWDFLENTGITTDTCFPYTAGNGTAPRCSYVKGKDCKNYKAHSAGALSTIENMQISIMTDGPIQAAFMVYKSFMTYNSGVYKKHIWEIEPEGGHAIKIIGWGTENSNDYWLIANSWGETWGDEGYFKILRGTNECGIEDNAYVGKASV